MRRNVLDHARTRLGRRPHFADRPARALVDPADTTLPSFTPGSHVVVTCGTGIDGRPRRNSYSLTGPGFEPGAYAISVRRDDAGRGGSRWIHALRVGERGRGEHVRAARSRRCSTARHHVLVAGGIGVTPILSHVRAAVQWGRSFEVHYTFRDDDGPHLDELRPAVRRPFTDLHAARTSSGTASGRPCSTAHRHPPVHVRSRAADRRGERHARACGLARCARPLRAFRVSLTSIPGTRSPPTCGAPADVTVRPGSSLLDALERQGVAVPNLCSQGVCGECRVPVCGGAVAHRDLYLTDAEKAAGDCVMPCVSRAGGHAIGAGPVSTAVDSRVPRGWPPSRFLFPATPIATAPTSNPPAAAW